MVPDRPFVSNQTEKKDRLTRDKWSAIFIAEVLVKVVCNKWKEITDLEMIFFNKK